MAVTPVVYGLVTVQIKAAGGPSYDTLGLTRNGVQLNGQHFALGIPGDENGGDEGPPIDFVYLGQVLRLDIELTKWDESVRKNLLLWHGMNANGGAHGQPAKPGTLCFANNNHYSLKLLCELPNDAANQYYFEFPRVVLLREPWVMNAGTRWAALRLAAEAFKDPSSGVLWQEGTT